MSTVEPCVSARARAATPSPCGGRSPAPTQTTGAREERALDEDRHAGGRRERRHARPGSKPVAATTSGGRATRASAAPAAAATLAGSARRSPGTSASTGRSSQMKTSDFTIWSRSHPIASAAPCAVGGRRELLEPRLRTRGAEEDGDALDGLGPRHRVDCYGRRRRVSTRTGAAAGARARGRRAYAVVGLRRAAAPRRASSPTQRRPSTDGERRAPGRSRTARSPAKNARPPA